MGISIYNTPLSERQHKEYLRLLESCGLRDEGDADIVALMTEDDELIACGALAGHTLKQLAVDSDAEGKGAMAAVLSSLIAEAYARGIHRLFLCTKPENLRMFGSMGFHIVIETKDAVLLAVGANKSTKLELEQGDSLNAIEFMYGLKAGKKFDLGKHVAIVGAGNTAMDAARAAKRVEGVEDVYIVYRRDIANMPADLCELEEAMEDGVIFRPLLAPITLENGKLVCEVMTLGEPDASGRRKPVPTGEKCEIPCDTVIASLGEKVDGDFYKSLGLELDEKGLPIEKDNIQIIGDGLSGPKTVVLAIASAAKAVYEICGADYWKYTELNFEYTGLSKRAVLNPNYNPCDPSRCLECGGLCGMCVESCPNRCNEYLEVNGKKQVIHIDCLCNECGNCAVFCPYDGRPFRDKITVFSDIASLDDSTNQGFVNLGNGKYAIRWNGEICECKLDEMPAELRDVVIAYEA